MSPSPKAADFDLFAKGVNREDLQDAAGFLGSLPPAQVEEAEDFILNAAWNCLRATEEENEAPTRPGFVKKLRETRSTARKLAKQLKSISGHVYPVSLYYNLLDIEAGYREGVYESDIEREALVHNPIETQRRLDFLIKVLTKVEKGLVERGLDKGTGRSPNWYKFLNGPPKSQLAWECHGIFEGYCPGKAKSTKEGVFDHFCAAVYGIALDVKPTAEGIGIHRYTEEVCRISAKLAQINDRLNEIRRALRVPNLSKKARLALMKDQKEYIRQLQAIESQYPW